MRAEKLYHRRQTYRNVLIEMAIWRLPTADPERPHGLKYRLVCVRDGQRLVGYDNERGKGDHRHLAEREEAYRFVSIRALLADSWTDVRGVSDE